MIYVCDNPFTDRELGPCVYVWADAPGEAEPALWAMSIDPEVARARYLNAWEAYRVPASYVPAFGVLGVTITDKFGPAIWCARRDKDARRLAILEAASRGLRA
jgi:hypothetical protein